MLCCFPFALSIALTLLVKTYGIRATGVFSACQYLAHASQMIRSGWSSTPRRDQLSSQCKSHQADPLLPPCWHQHQHTTLCWQGPIVSVGLPSKNAWQKSLLSIKICYRTYPPSTDIIVHTVHNRSSIIILGQIVYYIFLAIIITYVFVLRIDKIRKYSIMCIRRLTFVM